MAARFHLYSLFYLRSSDGQEIIDALDELPLALRPTHFTANEGRTKKQDLISDVVRFEQFRKYNPLGYFLVAKKCTYDVSLRPDDFSILFVDVKAELAEEEISQLLSAATAAGADFGFVSTEEEYHHRNRIFRTIGPNIIESWVGRDLNRYLPGVYWRTLISKSLSSERGLDWSCVPSCLKVSEFNNQWLLVKEDGGMEDWQQYANELDEYCESTTGFFSVRPVITESSMVDAFPQLEELLSRWR